MILCVAGSVCIEDVKADYNPYVGLEVMPILAKYSIDGAQTKDLYNYAFLNVLLGFRINEYVSIEGAYAFDVLNFQDEPQDFIDIESVASLYVKARYPLSRQSGIYANIGATYTLFSVSHEILRTASTANEGDYSSLGWMGGIGADYQVNRNFAVYAGFTWYPVRKNEIDIDLYVSNIGFQYYLPGLF